MKNEYSVVKYAVFVAFNIKASEQLYRYPDNKSGYRRAPWWIKENDVGLQMVKTYHFSNSIAINGKVFYWLTKLEGQPYLYKPMDRLKPHVYN